MQDEQWFQNMPAEDNHNQFVPAHAAAWRQHVLPKIAKKHGQLQWLEIGSFEGWSSSWVADHVIQPGDTLSCVDIWVVPQAEPKFDAKLAGRAHKYKMKSVQFLAQAITDNRLFDVVYIDGDHEAKSVIDDFVLAWHVVPIGGIIILDDYGLKFPGDNPPLPPQPAIDAILQIYATRIRILHKQWQVIIQKTWDRS